MLSSTSVDKSPQSEDELEHFARFLEGACSPNLPLASLKKRHRRLLALKGNLRLTVGAREDSRIHFGRRSDDIFEVHRLRL